MPDFSAYLDVAVDSVEAPKPLPAGHYFATIAKYEPREVEYEKGVKTPVLTLSFRISSADEDVEESELPEGGGKGRIVTKDYQLNDPESRGLFAIRRIAEEACGLPIKGYQFEDLLRTMIGQEVKVFNVPRASKTEEGVFYPNIQRVLAAH